MGGNCNQSNNCPLCQLLHWVKFKLAQSKCSCSILVCLSLSLSLSLCPSLSKNNRQVKSYKLILLKNPKSLIIIFFFFSRKHQSPWETDAVKRGNWHFRKPPDLPGLPLSLALTSLSHPIPCESICLSRSCQQSHIKCGVLQREDKRKGGNATELVSAWDGETMETYCFQFDDSIICIHFKT